MPAVNRNPSNLPICHLHKSDIVALFCDAFGKIQMCGFFAYFSVHLHNLTLIGMRQGRFIPLIILGLDFVS